MYTLSPQTTSFKSSNLPGVPPFHISPFSMRWTYISLPFNNYPHFTPSTSFTLFPTLPLTTALRATHLWSGHLHPWRGPCSPT